MFSLALLVLSALSPVLSAPASPQAGTISTPTNGSAIAPGAAFDFTYNVHADYCVSSYNFTVWLLTAPPSDLSAGDVTGHYFGRFSAENYPANPFPANPVPSQLVMPDFSVSPGGFGTGKTASNLPVYLAVVEEWSSCAASLGKTLSLTANPLVYNATKT